ncbi:MAG TPA: hypothetical protein VNW52_00580, partial [Burkholderiaceae bacterium]|nr:hypothetical protein [Burkholderiaceae bacterium]
VPPVGEEGLPPLPPPQAVSAMANMIGNGSNRALRTGLCTELHTGMDGFVFAWFINFHDQCCQNIS